LQHHSALKSSGTSPNFRNTVASRKSPDRQSIRRECLDHVIVFGERHLRHVLLSYMQYYNGARTHLSLNKDAPVPRTVQTVGRILPTPILGGLHHQYVRI
jgi:hypothetical protein